eukprot:CAMPEP_0196664932 /NCGR_PEP_ID=MMETSP1086-20130531/58998_1 /TAXON_ID=77921 /ORGANISM="Cyanoptyche  gloeocystis , Strain SAG4.97" /LENGTH=43 /DNA_ID= /DNA_START= /DNA_END= /DNA_ORIENTATION=
MESQLYRTLRLERHVLIAAGGGEKHIRRQGKKGISPRLNGGGK